MTPSQRKLRAQIAAHSRWANTADRTAATEPARQARRRHFETLVDPDGTLDPAERALRAKHAQRSHMLRMQLARHTKGKAI